MDHEPETPPRPVETWSAIALRDASGMFLHRQVTWRVVKTPSVFLAETWSAIAEMEAWLAERVSFFRSQVNRGGWSPVRVTCRVEALPGLVVAEANPEPRPLVAEAAVDA